MSDRVGFEIEGDSGDNTLKTILVNDASGDLLVYNILRGGEGNDTLTGALWEEGVDALTPYGVQLYGGSGNDKLWDSGGNDFLDGGAGDDFLQSSGGNDTVYGGDGVDTLSISSQAILSSQSLIVSGVEKVTFLLDATISSFNLAQFQSITAYSDTFIYFTKQISIQDLNFSNGDQWSFFGSAFGDTFDLSDHTGALRFYAGSGNDTLLGGKGKNEIWGESGDDHIQGGKKGDYLIGGKGDDIIYGGAGADLITDDSGNNTVSGGDGADTIEVAKGVSRIVAGDGNDEVRVSGTSSSIHGGEGDDVFYITKVKSDANWTVHGGAGADTLYGPENMAHFGVDGVETLSINAYHDALTISADALSSFDRILYGEIGIFHITLSTGGEFDWRKALDPFEGVHLTGSDQADTIDLTGSSDWAVNGDGGDDIIINAGAASGGAGNDTISGKSDLYGNSGNDVLTGSGDLFGGSGNDVLNGRNGTMTGGVSLSGGAGNDILRGVADTDYIDGGDGNDVLTMVSAEDGNPKSAVGGNGNDKITGGSRADILKGGNGNDILIAGSGNDYLYAGAGNDTLSGGKGDDYIELGAGKDVIVIGLKGGTDTIDGFSLAGNQHDVIDLSDTAIKNFNELMQSHVETVEFGSSQRTLITVDGATKIWLADYSVDDLDKTMFLF